MSLAIILTLFILALILCLVETFLIPGFGICGILSAACALIGVGACFVSYGILAGMLSSVVVIVAGALLLYGVMHSKRLEHLSLHAKIDSSVANKDVNTILVGDRGVALTRLALVGNARIGNVECEVRSANGFIEENTSIEVVKINMGEVYVVACDAN